MTHFMYQQQHGLSFGTPYTPQSNLPQLNPNAASVMTTMTQNVSEVVRIHRLWLTKPQVARQNLPSASGQQQTQYNAFLGLQNGLNTVMGLSPAMSQPGLMADTAHQVATASSIILQELQNTICTLESRLEEQNAAINGLKAAAGSLAASGENREQARTKFDNGLKVSLGYPPVGLPLTYHLTETCSLCHARIVRGDWTLQPQWTDSYPRATPTWGVTLHQCRGCSSP